MTTLSFDPALIDATTRTERLPVTEVIEVSFRYPWAAGTAPAREWHTEVQHCLDLRHAGDSFAAVIDAARPALCLDLDAGEGRWLALYPAQDAQALVAELQALANSVTEVAEVRELTIDADRPAVGQWGDDMTQVELYEPRPVGLAAGQFEVPADFNAPLPSETEAAFRGE